MNNISVPQELVEHWDINRHLKNSRIDAEFIGEKDKKEILRRIALKMQSGPDGLAGNFIHKQVLQHEIEVYLIERFSLAPDRANIVTKSIINQFRSRNFILAYTVRISLVLSTGHFWSISVQVQSLKSSMIRRLILNTSKRISMGNTGKTKDGTRC